ncbi:MAG: FtsX-like permease family protein [Candidatus Hodarchaeota archaeon]
MRKYFDLVSLTIDLIRNNMNLILPTIVGLVIALSVLSEAFIVVESSQEGFFNEIVFDSPDKVNSYVSDISVELSSFYPAVAEADRFTAFSHYDSIFETALLNGDYTRYISEYFWFTSPYISLNSINISHPVDTISYTCSSSEMFNLLEEYLNIEKTGRLPQNSSEIIIIRPKVGNDSEYYHPFIHSITLNSTITLELPQFLHTMAELSEDNRANKTVKIVGLVELQTTLYTYKELDRMTQIITKYLNHSWTHHAILTYPTFLNEILDEVYDDRVFELIEVYSSRYFIPHMRGKVYLSQTSFNAYQSQEELQKMEIFFDILSEAFEAYGYNAVIHSFVLDRIRTYIAQSSNLLLMLFLVGTPIVAVSFYLMIYSFELIKRQKKRQLGVIKTRGGSWKQIVIALYGEITLLTVVAAILGFIISIFLTNLTLRSTGYIEFLGNQIEVRIKGEILLVLVIIGIFSASLLNFYRIIKMARDDIEEATIPLEKRDPFWKRYYIDIIVFILGILIWFAILFLTRSLADSAVSGNIPFQIFFIIAPFLILLGTILIIGRLFYFSIQKLAKIAWKVDWGILSFAIHNIMRYKHPANRAGLLLTLTVSFSIISSSLIFSLDETQDLRSYCISGGDMSFPIHAYMPPQRNIYNDWKWKSSIDNNAVQLIGENISHIASVSTIFTGQGITVPGYGLTITYHYNFLFVDPTTYGDTIRIHPTFQLSGNLTTLLEKLNSNSSVLILNQNYNSLNAKIGHQLDLPIYSYYFGWNTDRKWRIEGTFSYWPNLLPDPSANYETDVWMIGSVGLLERLVSNSYISSLEAKCIIKVDSLEHIGNIAESIENLTGYTPFIPSIETIKYIDSFTRRFNLSVLNTNVIITVIVAIICMIMFAFYIQIERGKEIGIERALGKTRLQTSLMFLIEASIILIFGLIFGFITGMFFTAVFFQITQIGALATPFVIVYPLQIVPILIGIFIFAGIGTLIPAYLASRTDISRILKVE